MFWERAIHKYVNILVYVHIRAILIFQSTKLGLTFEAHFFLMALNAFWKELLIYLCKSLNLCSRRVICGSRVYTGLQEFQVLGKVCCCTPSPGGALHGSIRTLIELGVDRAITLEPVECVCTHSIIFVRN